MYTCFVLCDERIVFIGHYTLIYLRARSIGSVIIGTYIHSILYFVSVRKQNDSLFLLDWPRRYRFFGIAMGIYLICDLVGGNFILFLRIETMIYDIRWIKKSEQYVPS